MDCHHPHSHLHLASVGSVSYTHLRAHETRHDLVCRLLVFTDPSGDRDKKKVLSRQQDLGDKSKRGEKSYVRAI